jgi:hypothetical protein
MGETTPSLPITATIGNRHVRREDVRAWELARARKVARKLRIDPAGDLATLNGRLVARKLELGHAGIERLLARDLRLAAAAARGGAALSRTRRLSCAVALSSPSGHAEAVPAWYALAIANNDERPLIAACPDHYVSRTNPDGTQEIIETTGGAPFPVRMFFDDSDTTSIRTSPDTAFPTQWISVARTAGGTPIGGVRHQFRDRASGGFDIKLTVEFPFTTLPHMIAAHRRHLACEFSNWLETINHNS